MGYWQLNLLPHGMRVHLPPTPLLPPIHRIRLCRQTWYPTSLDGSDRHVPSPPVGYSCVCKIQILHTLQQGPSQTLIEWYNPRMVGHPPMATLHGGQVLHSILWAPGALLPINVLLLFHNLMAGLNIKTPHYLPVPHLGNQEWFLPSQILWHHYTECVQFPAGRHLAPNQPYHHQPTQQKPLLTLWNLKLSQW